MRDLRKSVDEYLHWLYEIVGGKDGPCGEYYSLMSVLLNINFIWFVEHDENRAEDGLILRDQYCLEVGKPLYLKVYEKECSVLEMMIALARRIDTDIMYEGDEQDTTGLWFKQMIDNLGLEGYTDGLWDANKHEYATYLIDSMLERTYDYSGSGGLFPLKQPMEDQRTIEIWRQMSSFLYENSYQKPYQN